MNFKRCEVQLWWERTLGCRNLDDWPSFKSAVMKSKLMPLDEPMLKRAVSKDMISFGQKAVLSFLEGLESIINRHFAWGIVKLYYCIFYCLRFEILYSNHILLRCKSLFLMSVKLNEAFTEIKNKKQGDHQLTIIVEEKLVADGIIRDTILDNKLEGMNPYMWLLSQRERINYRQSLFPDPDCDETLEKPFNYIETGKINDLFSMYANDPILAYIFDKEHSMISIPFYRTLQVCKKVDWTKVKHRQFAHMATLAFNIGISKCTIEKLLVNSTAC